MNNLRPRTSILKRPGGVGVLSSVNDRGTMAGRGWVRLDTEDRNSFDLYDNSSNPPTYGESQWPSSSHAGASGANGGANPGAEDATAFRVYGTNRYSGGFRMVRGARVDVDAPAQPAQARQVQVQEPRVVRLAPIDTSRGGPPSDEGSTTPTPHSPPTPRASRMSHGAFRADLHRYDTFGRRREETPSALFDVDDATVQTAIAGQRAGRARPSQ
jgi:hypothetical protein